MKKSNLLLAAACSAAVAFTSCSKDLQGTSYFEAQKQAYTSNFEAKYGAINPNQTWDFTTGERQLATRGYSAIKTTIMEEGISFGDVSQLDLTFVNKAGGYNIINGGATKNNALIEAIRKSLPEEKKWLNQKPAVLVAPSSSFYIYPIFSGGNLRYDVNIKVGDQDPVTVFKKDYVDFQTINGMKTKNGKIVNMRGLKIEAPVGTPIEIYVDNRIQPNGNKYNGVMGTTNGKSTYVDIPEGIVPEMPEGVKLKENAIVKYIGLEDLNSGESTDNDYNDVVLAVIGDPDIPQEKIIENDTYQVKTARTKRYMVEDLGATDDFDFNDLVVDVSENTIATHTVTLENGVMKSDIITLEEKAPSTAVIRAMGGTIDFELTIGQTKWVKSENGFEVKTMYNTQGTIDFNKELAVFDVEGWTYDGNQVEIKVQGKDGKLFSIVFPKAGEAPMIIAVDPTQKWMGERISVPSSWFTE